MPQLTIEVTQENLDRLVAAFTGIRQEDDDDAPEATPADVRQFIIDKLKNMVMEYEKREAKRQLAAPSEIELD